MHVPGFLYGTAWKEDRTAALVELAIRTGFRAIDTANQRKHYFEAAVGEGLVAAYDAGIVTRADLFLQTKFTSLGGQDDRLPYDRRADLATQVSQSMASSLEHLRTDYVDSYVLHGPSSNHAWTDADSQVWIAMMKERDTGRTRALGVSNISLRQLQQMAARHSEPPAFVQNRCFARHGWDRDVRAFCRDRNIVYQGFSLLTANHEVVEHPMIAELARAHLATPAQIMFRLAKAMSILPMTGTSSELHMQQDLASLDLELSREFLDSIDPD